MTAVFTVAQNQKQPRSPSILLGVEENAEVLAHGGRSTQISLSQCLAWSTEHILDLPRVHGKTISQKGKGFSYMGK